MMRFCFLVVLGLLWFSLQGPAFFQNPLPEPDIDPKDRLHWAFIPPQKQVIPALAGPQENLHPIDYFLLEKLRASKLDFSPQASKTTLIRRLFLDLTGLPPSPQEVEQFLNDRSPDAYGRLVEKLLASPHYGERWGHYWLDLVRYAETNGYELDQERPQAWRFRDYVVRSFNQDLPYPQFLLDQVAGDLLAKSLLLPKEELSAGIQRNPRIEDGLIAAGFLRCGPTHVVSGNLDPDQLRQEVLTEMATSIGSVFMGLTIGCARCHDHKFDPVSQVDYYRLQAFVGATYFTDAEMSSTKVKKTAEEEMTRWKKQTAPLKKTVEALEFAVQARLVKVKIDNLEPGAKAAWNTDPKQRTLEQHKITGLTQQLVKVTWDEIVEALPAKQKSERDSLKKKIHELERRKPQGSAMAPTVFDRGTPSTAFLKRGNPKNKGALVPPGYPRVLLGAGVTQKFSSELTRIDLARWLTSPNNPLTFRVFVNRIWLQMFGSGLVSSPGDFGIRTKQPMHLPLLDWLVQDFLESGGSVKRLHRQIVLSRAYRQESKNESPLGLQVDPGNSLLWRMNRKRLDAEFLRDSILTVSGSFSSRMAGYAVRSPLEPEVYDLIFTESEPVGLWPTSPDETEHHRRSIYLFNKRNVRLPLLEAFDQPDTLNPCPVRNTSTHSLQALTLMNGPFSREMSVKFAKRVMRDGGSKQGKQIELAWMLAFSRMPEEEESALARQFLQNQEVLLRNQPSLGNPPAKAPGPDFSTPQFQALADLCLALINASEFVYRP